MYTLCIRYTLDPNRVKHFRDYVEHELEAIRRAGGKIVGYWLPTDFAGPTNIAYGLIDFLTLASYEQYRKALAEDPLHQRNADELTRSGAVRNTWSDQSSNVAATARNPELVRSQTTLRVRLREVPTLQ